MTSRTKEEEVQFYLDRSKESVVTILRSIISNPRLSEQERFGTLRQIAEHHRFIAELVQQRLDEGERRGYELASQALATRQGTVHS